MDFLSLLVMKYKLDIKPEPEFANETFEEKKERVLRYSHGLTITWVTQVMTVLLAVLIFYDDSPPRVPLTFTKRS